MKSIENFLQENPAWRRVMLHLNGGFGGLESGHDGVLLWDDNQLHYADGNNYYSRMCLR